MHMQRILIPIAQDQSLDQRFEPVLACANSCNARVVLLNVIDDLPASALPGENTHSTFELLSFAECQQLERLTECASYANTKYPNIQIDTQVAHGKVFLKILETGLRENSDVVVIDANRGAKKTASQLGSTTRHLMRKSKIPVWTLAGKPAAKIDSIVAAVDVAEETTDGRALNVSILRSAAFLARQIGATLTMCYAWHLYGEGYLKHWAKLSDLEIAQQAKQERSLRLAECQQLLESADLKDIEVDMQLLEGQPEQVLPDFTHKKNIDLLVMGTVCRTGLPGVLIGNTAESMLDAVDCSVVTLKPESFESPVSFS